MDSSNSAILVFIVFCVGVFLFVLCREITCWYFKLNEIVVALNAILHQLVKLNLSIARKKEEKEQ